MGNLNFDDSILSGFNSAIASSALQASQIATDMESIREYQQQKDDALFEMSEASVAQKLLLEQQLIEVKEQNNLLKTNYDTLNELYQLTKKQAEDSEKEAKKNRILGWVSFAVGTSIGIIGVVAGIII